MALVYIVSSDGLVFHKFNLRLFILFLRILNTEKEVNKRLEVSIDFKTHVGLIRTLMGTGASRIRYVVSSVLNSQLITGSPSSEDTLIFNTY